MNYSFKEVANKGDYLEKMNQTEGLQKESGFERTKRLGKVILRQK